jgi:hypothetical protein
MSINQIENIQGCYPAARIFAQEHGQQCAKEILEWKKTGIYNGTRLAELANIIRPIDSSRDMQMAEDLVSEVALVKLASNVEPNDLLALFAQLEEQADNYCQALAAVRDSGEIQNQFVMDMLERGLNNQPQAR